MLPKRIKNKTYKFKTQSEFITFTPLTEIFSQDEIEQVIIPANFEPHQCHKNAAIAAGIFKCEYCEGIIYGILDHAFNRIERNGKVYYFDVTEFANNKYDSNKIETTDILLLRVYNLDNILEVLSDFGMYFITTGRMTNMPFTEKYGCFIIDDDGKARNVVDYSDTSKLIFQRNNLYNTLKNEKD